MAREALRRLIPWIREGVRIVVSIRERALGSDAVSIYYETARLLERAELLSGDWKAADWRVDDRRIYQGT
jgi:ribonuclease P protein component